MAAPVAVDLAIVGSRVIHVLQHDLVKNKKAARSVATAIANSLALVTSLDAAAVARDDVRGVLSGIQFVVGEVGKYASQLAAQQRTWRGVWQLRTNKATNGENLAKFTLRITELTGELRDRAWARTAAAVPVAPLAPLPAFPADDPALQPPPDDAGDDVDANEMRDAVGPLPSAPGSAPSRGIDLVVLMDATNSMKPWVHEATSAIEGMIALVRDTKAVRERKKPLRVAFVFYRDIDDETAPRDPWRVKVVPFSSKTAAIAGALAAVGVGGLGRDFPEDVEGGLREVLKLDWRLQTRIVVHIADAPGHGAHMHTADIADNFPAEGQRTEELMTALAALGVDYYLVKLNRTMDVMAAKLAAAHVAGGGGGGAAAARSGRESKMAVVEGLDAVLGASSFLHVVLSSVSSSMRTDPARYAAGVFRA